MNQFRQFCGVARALDIVGERWTLLIVRDLLLGGRTFTQLQRGLDGISSSVLSQRLRRLRECELVEREEDTYVLTNAGRGLEPVVLALGAFGSQYLDRPRPDDRLDPRWAMLSLKRRFRSAGGRGTALFKVGGSEFTITWEPYAIQVRDGVPAEPDVELVGALPGWFALLTRRTTLTESLDSEALAVSGRTSAALDILGGLGVRVE